MIRLVSGVSPVARSAIEDLERRATAVDGGRLKLELGYLDGQTNDEVHEVFWEDDGRLVGFLGLYSFGGGPDVELAGMVDPQFRRRGIGTALLDAALPVCRDRGHSRALLVTPRNAAGGREFALGRGGVLEHSEYALVLDGEPSDGRMNPAVSLRRAHSSDVDEVTRLMNDAFGWQPTSDVLGRLDSGIERTLVVQLHGTTVGTVRLTHHGDTGGIYGLAIDPVWQGRGIGGDVLRRICRELRAEGARRVALEVVVDNERALGLYTRVGFQRVMTEDYYALAL